MAHKKGAGSTKNGRDSNSQRLGVKVYGNQLVKAGGIVVRDTIVAHTESANTDITHLTSPTPKIQSW